MMLTVDVQIAARRRTVSVRCYDWTVSMLDFALAEGRIFGFPMTVSVVQGEVAREKGADDAAQ